MKFRGFYVAAIALAILAGACVESPAASPDTDPRFDGGWTIGSGGRTDTTTTTTTQAGGEGDRENGGTYGSGG